MTKPILLPRAELVEIIEEERVEVVEIIKEERVEEETEEPAEEMFYGFEQREVEEALELQAIFRENNAEREMEKDVDTESEESPKKREHLSPRERKRRKAVARAR